MSRLNLFLSLAFLLFPSAHVLASFLDCQVSISRAGDETLLVQDVVELKTLAQDIN